MSSSCRQSAVPSTPKSHCPLRNTYCLRLFRAPANDAREQLASIACRTLLVGIHSGVLELARSIFFSAGLGLARQWLASTTAIHFECNKACLKNKLREIHRSSLAVLKGGGFVHREPPRSSQPCLALLTTYSVTQILQISPLSSTWGTKWLVDGRLNGRGFLNAAISTSTEGCV